MSYYLGKILSIVFDEAVTRTTDALTRSNQMNLEDVDIFQAQTIRGGTKIPAELRYGAELRLLRRWRQIADRHVPDHAAAKRADLNHRKISCLKGWASKNPRSSQTGGNRCDRSSTAAQAASFNPPRVNQSADWYYTFEDFVDVVRPSPRILKVTSSDAVIRMEAAWPCLNWRGALAGRPEKCRVRTRLPRAHISIEHHHEADRQGDR